MIAGNYPQFDEKKGRVVSFEDALNDCRVANNEPIYRLDDPATMGLLSAYARSLSDGMKLNVRVSSAAAQKAFEAGKQVFYGRHGQQNFACAHCHADYAGYRWAGQTLSPALGQATHWPIFRTGNRPVTLQMRYAECFRLGQHVPDKVGSLRMNNLEYFHSYLSNGLPLRANALRDLAP
jgi:sulfur-oxidizing protein SoxA